MAPHHVERASVKFRHDEVTPFMQPRPADRVRRHIEIRRSLKGLAQVLNNCGALGENKAAVPKNRDLVSRIQLQEFFCHGLAGARLNGMKLVLEIQFEEHPMRPHGAAGTDSPQSQVVRHGLFSCSVIPARAWGLCSLLVETAPLPQTFLGSESRNANQA